MAVWRAHPDFSQGSIAVSRRRSYVAGKHKKRKVKTPKAQEQQVV